MSNSVSIFSRLVNVFTSLATPGVADVKKISLLERIGKGTLSSLTLLPHYQERLKELEVLGKKVLELGGKFGSIDWRQFGLLNNSKLIKDTKLEGGNFFTSLQAAIQFLEDYETGSASFFALEENTDSILKDLKAALKNMLVFDALHMHLIPLESRAAIYLKHIQSQLANFKTIFLPLGYRHGVGNEGHALACRVEQDKTHVIVSFFNTGNGSDSHPVINYTETSEKVSYVFYPIYISKDLFFGEVGHAAICHLIRYMVDPPRPELASYQGSDIYDIFLMLGEVKPDLGPNVENTQANSQFSGDCPEKAIGHIIHDFLVEKLSFQDVQKVFVNYHFYSLIKAYNSYKAGNAPSYALDLIMHSAKEVGAFLIDSEQFLSEEEFTSAAAGLHEILKLKDGARYAAFNSQKQIPSLLIQKISPNFPPIPPSKPSSHSFSHAKVLPFSWPQPVFNPANFQSELEASIALLVKLPGKEALDYIKEYINALPIPQYNKEDAWDLVPLSDIRSILCNLEKLCYEALVKQQVIRVKNTLFTSKFLIISTLYAITDKLARRVKETKLKGFTSPFFPPPLTIEPNGFTTLPIEKENTRYHEVVCYFEENLKGSFPLFPISQIYVEQFIEDHKNGNVEKQRMQGKNHIAYLQQFILDSFPHASNRELTPLYIELWKDENRKYLPREVHTLYYFAYLFQTLVITGWEDCTQIPSFLTFSEELNDLGKRSIQILGSPFLKNIDPDKAFQVRNFEENGIDSSFIPFDSKAIKSLTLNDALCIRLSGELVNQYQVAEAEYRDFLRITRKENLKLFLALNWAAKRSNIILLQNKGVQKALDACFFDPGYLQKRLKEEGAPLIEKFRKFIEEGLKYYAKNRNHINTTLFLLRSGIAFEGFLKKPEYEKYREALISLLKMPFNENQKTKIIFHLIFLESESPLASFDFALLFQTSLTLSDYHDYDYQSPIWLRSHFRDFAKSIAQKMQELFKDPSYVNRACKTILENIAGVKTDASFEGIFPEYSDGKYRLNFFNGELKHEEFGVLTNRPGGNYGFNSVDTKWLKHKFYWKNNKQLVSFDETLKIPNEDRVDHWEVELTIKKTKQNATPYIPEESIESPFAFLTHRKWTLFQCEAQVFGYYPEERSPYFVIESSGPNAIIRRLTKDADPLPIVITDLSSINEADPLYNFTLRYARAKEVVCFVNEQTRRIEELHFLTLNLEFKRQTIEGPLLQGKEVLKSTEFPGFFLVEDDAENKAGLSCINHYQGAFLLRNASGKFLIILPKSHLKQSEHDFDPEIKQNGLVYSKYFVFEETAFGLISQEQSAYFYLALLLKMQRDYVKAYDYLKKVKTTAFFNERDMQILYLFSNLRDRSPDSAAFNLKLLLLIIENKNLLLEEQFTGKTKSNEYKELIKWGEKCYIDYFKIDSAISAEIYLTDTQEKIILFTLKTFIDSQDPIVNSRFNMFFNSTKKTEITIPSRPVSLVPKSFQNIHPSFISPKNLEKFNLKTATKEEIERSKYIPHPIRLHEEAILANFPTLYEMAKNASPNTPDPFDFVLMALCKSRVNGPVGSALFYVRHFPSQFQDLSFNMKDKASTIMEINSRVDKLKDKYPPNTLLNKTKIFRFNKKIELHLTQEVVTREAIPESSAVPKPQDLLSQINKILNRPCNLIRQGVIKEVIFQLKMDTKKILFITPQMMMKEVILKNDISFLKKHRPMLSPIQIGNVCTLVKMFYHQEVLKISGDAPLNYDPLEYPEISYFKIQEGKLPKAEQIEVYKWICERLEKKEHCHFQQPAGRGKTSYLIPLLVLRAKRVGLMAVIFSTGSMYSVDKQNLGNTFNLLGVELAFAEVGLHMKLSLEELKLIYFQLAQGKKQDKALIMTPQIFYALHLMYLYAAIKEKDKDRVNYLGKIIYFLKNECLLILDESHQNLDALTRAIFGVGSIFKLPDHQQQHFLSLMQPIIKLMDPVLGIEKINMSLGELYANIFHLDEEFASYWTNKKALKPERLIQWQKTDKAKADLISLTNYFLSTLLPQILKMRTEIDHCQSLYPEEEFESPCHNKTPSTAEFEDIYKTAALSIKGTFHRGLSKLQVSKFLTTLLKEHNNEVKGGIENTDPNAKLRSWLVGSKYEDLSLEDINFADPTIMEELTFILKRNPLVIALYLLTTILPQISSTSSEQLISTPSHLLSGFATSISCSATPLRPIAYPQAIKSFYKDPFFESNVLAQLRAPQNARQLFVKDASVFFQEMMKEQNKELFNSATMFIDPRGFFSDFNNHTVAKVWLEASQLDGVIFFNEERVLKVDREEKPKLLDKQGKITDYTGVMPQGKIGIYFDAAHSEAANVIGDPNAIILFFLSKGLTKSRKIQAVMRARGFLDKQSLVWIIPDEVAFLTKTDVPSIEEWTEKNENEEMGKRVILNAFQEIAFKIQNLASTEIEKAHKIDPQIAMTLMQKYSKGFTEFSDHDPYKAFSDHEKNEDTRLVLERYAREYYKLFNYELPLEEQHELTGEINDFISKVEEEVKTIASNFNKAISKEIEQHCRLLNETEQMEFRPRAVDPISADGVYGSVNLIDHEFPSAVKQVLAKDLYNEPLTENFYFEKNQLHTAVKGGKSLKEDYLKPIDFFLILIEDGHSKPSAIAISNEIISTYLNELIDAPEDGGPLISPHKAFLVTAEGMLVQKGRGILAPSEADVEKILSSLWLKDLATDAAFLKGQLLHPERLAERIENGWGWNKFHQFRHKVLSSLPNMESAELAALKKFQKTYGPKASPPKN